jgi:ribokinase
MIIAGLGQCSLDYLAVVDSYPPVDTKSEVIEWQEEGGGPVATALVALSRLGLSSRFSGVIGDDEAGKKIKQSLISEGIDLKGLVQRRKSASQIAFIMIEQKTGKRTIFWKRPQGPPLSEREIRDDFFKEADFLLLDGLMKEASLAAAEKARSMNIPVMLDAGRMRPGMLEIARLSDYVVASEEFAKDLDLACTAEALQKERQRLGIKVLTITLGEKGSITVTDGQEIELSAFSVRIIDTTGAGDVFHGGFIYGLLQKWSLHDTGTFASAVAAIKCSALGGRSGIPDLQEVKLFLRDRGLEIPALT